jgi:NADH dehydrogenase [ubiquinone] 1 alpha subcomplex assembly factor 5
MMTSMTVPVLFDQMLIRQHRQRAAPKYSDFTFLKDAAAARLADRLELMRRDFDLCLDIGAHDGRLAQHFAELGKIGHMVHADPAEKFAIATKQHGPSVVHALDKLPYRPEAFDAVFSCLSLHWIDDLPGLIMQAGRLLKPDGLLLFSLFGGNSLTELKQALAEAEQDITGGFSPRCAPMADIRDIGGLLSRAGLALPVADSDRLTVNYPHMFKLMSDLRGMGEQNALFSRLKTPTRRQVFMRAAEIYQQRFGRAGGQIPASFEIVTLTGWAPHESQQKPLRPGTAMHRLASVLETEEQDPEVGV